ncbi:MGH1-like glycoside hydrolase domain-containing protein [Sphingomonas crusticola]|uniref:MGH1-like glycoside hydrolase domain-containing protein n=1 Tax=Sphingomonas crusticola TaxID=1697973 RepID=UPI000E2864BE|nr:alpha-L-rhamnosidase [Sphingomonas crusticola]
MNRRSFLAGSSAAVTLVGASRIAVAQPAGDAPTFSTGNSRWQSTYDAALNVLAANVRTLPYVSKPVLIEGSVYQGIWQECGPHEALVYRKFRPDVARNSHLTFFELQRADGQLPANNKIAETSFGQIQMVVPIAATAWELAHATGDSELLEAAYRGCSAWDAWLMRYRNTRGSGLIEGFCTYDTGHDNSPRWKGMPNQCPNKDARTHHPVASLPRLCPDLSATVYGGRRALAHMARALGRRGDADRWDTRANDLRDAILKQLYVAEDAAFYDLDAQNQFVRVRSDILTRVCGEHVVDQRLFDQLWARQLHNPQAFWTPYPLPSIALDDPQFVRPIPANSWGGAAQALTALRAGRWFDHYRRSAEFSIMMDRWCEALQRDPTFHQQMDPVSGVFTHGADQPGYSPAALVMVDYSWRLVGVTEEPDSLHWNVRPRHPAARDARMAMRTDTGAHVTMRYASGGADLQLSGKAIARLEGGAARLITDKQGAARALVGIEPEAQPLLLRLPGRSPRNVTITANQVIAL